MQGDTTFITQTTPRPTRYSGGGVSYGGNTSVGMRGWQVTNLVDASQYLGNGGTHSAPDVALEVVGPWKRSMSMQAGEQAAFAVNCNSHGCGKWNSPYNLFELQSNVGIDTVPFAPGTSTLAFNLRGTQYSFSPTAFTAGTIQRDDHQRRRGQRSDLRGQPAALRRQRRKPCAGRGAGPRRDPRQHALPS